MSKGTESLSKSVRVVECAFKHHIPFKCWTSILQTLHFVEISLHLEKGWWSRGFKCKNWHHF